MSVAAVQGVHTKINTYAKCFVRQIRPPKNIEKRQCSSGYD